MLDNGLNSTFPTVPAARPPLLGLDHKTCIVWVSSVKLDEGVFTTEKFQDLADAKELDV